MFRPTLSTGSPDLNPPPAHTFFFFFRFRSGEDFSCIIALSIPPPSFPLPFPSPLVYLDLDFFLSPHIFFSNPHIHIFGKDPERGMKVGEENRKKRGGIFGGEMARLARCEAGGAASLGAFLHLVLPARTQKSMFSGRCVV